MVTEAEQATRASEYLLQEMSDRIVEQFQAEQVFLLGGRVTGRGQWIEVELLIVLSGEWATGRSRPRSRTRLWAQGLGSSSI